MQGVRKVLVAGGIALAIMAGGTSVATAGESTAEAVCTTFRSSDGKTIGVRCDTGRYYVLGTACGPGGCTQIGGNVVNAPQTSTAYAGSGYFGGDIKAVFV